MLRLSAIGDTCHTLPVVRSLHAAWPQTRITWILGKTEAALLGDIPGIEFIIFDKRQGWHAYRDLRAALRGRRFDVLLHMQAALRASIASLCIPARLRLGFDRVRARDFQWLFSNARIAHQPRQHVMDGLFGFAEALGVRERVLRWDIPIPADAERFAATHIPATTPALLISPCSSQRARNYRNWSAENYATIADYASEHYGLRVILTGGPTALEKYYGEQISTLAKHAPLNLIGATSLKQLYALIRSARCVLCPDSGPVHMATAAGTPVIGLYASSNPLRTGPYHSMAWTVNRYPDALVAEGLTVETARWGQRVRDPATMQLISVSDVTAKLDAIMAASLREKP